MFLMSEVPLHPPTADTYVVKTNLKNVAERESDACRNKTCRSVDLISQGGNLTKTRETHLYKYTNLDTC